MAVILPFLAFVLLLLCIAGRGTPWRRAFLLAALCWGTLLTLTTELLSLFHGINHLWLSLIWGAISLGASLEIYRTRNTLQPIKAKKECIIALIPIGVILATTGTIAILSPPNNWDSMTYHMGRVVHWIQNQSVAHYPTNAIRQLYFAPWAEFAIMHLQILSGGDDYLANLVQWFAMCGSLVGVTLIAEQFGADRPSQLLAALLAATTPMGILQSSSTQNDYVVAFWLVCFVYFGIQLLSKRTLLDAIPVGTALALAILTKGTAYIYAFPFVIWFLATILYQDSRQLPKYVLIISTLVLALNCGHYLRNYALWGNPLAEDIDQVQTTRRDVPAFLSNLSRNLVSNTWTPVPGVNDLQYQIVNRFHKLLAIDINDPKTTLDVTKFTPVPLSLHEDVAGNALHTLLLLTLLPTFLFGSRGTVLSQSRLYLLSLTTAIMLFCLMLKWQPWVTRLQLPGFVLAAPLAAIAMPAPNRQWVSRAIAGLLLIAAIPWLFYNQSRPLIGEWSIIGAERDTLYFANNRELLPHFDRAASLIAATPGCSQVAIYGAEDPFEYPLWALLRHRTATMPRIEYINIANISKKIPLKDFNPCLKVEIN
jgi:4-amino-4-deoxy-L-arabinose transferase-like glycosyltransferase